MNVADQHFDLCACDPSLQSIFLFDVFFILTCTEHRAQYKCTHEYEERQAHEMAYGINQATFKHCANINRYIIKIEHR